MPIDTITYAGTDYTIQDTTARTNATNALNLANQAVSDERKYRQAPPSFFWTNPENNSNNTYSEARGKDSYFYWSSFNTNTANAGWYPYGMLMQTTKAVTAGTLIDPGVNCTPTSIADKLGNIKTYVGSDDKLHFTNYDGADSVLNFSSFDPGNEIYLEADGSGKTITISNVKRALIIHYALGNEASNYHSAMKIYYKNGSNFTLRLQGGDYSRLSYSGVTANSVTLSYNPYGYPYHACLVYPY